MLEVIRQNFAGRCQQNFENKKFVDITLITCLITSHKLSHQYFEFSMKVNDGIESRLSSYIFSTLKSVLLYFFAYILMKILLFLFRHPIKAGNQYLENYAGLTCLTLSCKLGRDDLFMDMLELSCKEFWRYSNICCSGKFVIITFQGLS